MKLKANLDFEWNGKKYKQAEEFETDAQEGGSIIHAGLAFEVYPSDLMPSQDFGPGEPSPMKVDRLPEPETVPASEENQDSAEPITTGVVNTGVAEEPAKAATDKPKTKSKTGKK